MKTPRRTMAAIRKDREAYFKANGNRWCSHGIIEDHKVNGEWRCMACSRFFKWNDESSWYGRGECPKCGFDRIEYVVCSSACRETANRAKRGEKAISSHPARVTEKVTQAEREKLDAQDAIDEAIVERSMGDE